MTSAYWSTGHRISRVSRCTLWQVGPLRKRNIFQSRGLWTRRELINVEVLSGRIDGPTFSPLCRPLIDACSQCGPRSHSADVCRTHAGLFSCCTFLCCVGFALPAWLWVVVLPFYFLFVFRVSIGWDKYFKLYGVNEIVQNYCPAVTAHVWYIL